MQTMQRISYKHPGAQHWHRRWLLALLLASGLFNYILKWSVPPLHKTWANHDEPSLLADGNSNSWINKLSQEGWLALASITRTNWAHAWTFKPILPRCKKQVKQDELVEVGLTKWYPDQPPQFQVTNSILILRKGAGKKGPELNDATVRKK